MTGQLVRVKFPDLLRKVGFKSHYTIDAPATSRVLIEISRRRESFIIVRKGTASRHFFGKCRLFLLSLARLTRRIMKKHLTLNLLLIASTHKKRRTLCRSEEQEE